MFGNVKIRPAPVVANRPAQLTGTVLMVQEDVVPLGSLRRSFCGRFVLIYPCFRLCSLAASEKMRRYNGGSYFL